MISDLPQDLLEEILSRVPAKYVKRVRSTCKRWRALFSDQIFIANRYRNASKESKVLMLSMSENNVIPMRVNINITPPSIEFEGALSLTNFHLNPGKSYYISTVFHCNGLLLCTTVDLTLMVWNPCLGEPVWIKLDTDTDRYSWFALGYEKKASGHSYKIFMKPHNQRDRFKIYEFSSDSWRVLDVVLLDHCRLSNISVSLKGNIYWIASDNGAKFLLSFDFTVERFKCFKLPNEQNLVVALSVFGDKQLAVYTRHVCGTKMNVWVSNEIDSDFETELKYWSISFTFDTPNVRLMTNLGSYLIEEKKILVVYYLGQIKKVYVIGEKGDSYREICVEPTYLRSWCPRIINYFPTLVQVQKGV